MLHLSHPAQARALTADLQAFARVADSADFGSAIGPELARAQLDAMTATLDHMDLPTSARIAAEAAIEALREALSL